ncbi:MAG: TonB-dependent receptor [Ferruginibacter sp.]|nr:TonB-dependent receptor [Cytophagales bacterium]
MSIRTNSDHPTKPFSIIPAVFLGLLLVSSGAYAQQAFVKGRVTTRDGKPAAYVNLGLKELNRATAAAEDGSYALKNIPEGSYTVVASFVGLQTQQQSVRLIDGQTSELNFVLAESAQQLSEIVVMGTRTPNEKPVAIGKVAIHPMDLPQSITIVDRKTMDQQQVLRMSDVLRNANGVYVMGTTGGTQEEIAARGFAFGSSNTFKNGVRFNNGVMPEMSSLENG